MRPSGDHEGLRRALRTDRAAILEAVSGSGLRSRGGPGFATAAKWQACIDAGSASAGVAKPGANGTVAAQRGAAGVPSGSTYVVCNAVDADPRSLIVATLLSSRPTSVLEGLLIAAYAVGAAQGFVCVNAEHQARIAAIEEELDRMRHAGLLGEDVLGSGFDFEVAVAAIPPLLVAGEETALIRVLEGRQAIPYLCPPYPATRGLYGRPTLVHGAETLAAVSTLFGASVAAGPAPGSAQPAAVPENAATGLRSGVEPAPGAKVVTVRWGDESRVVTVPLGTTLRRIVEEVTGLDAEGGEVKAVRFGGPTGGFFAGAGLDTPIDFQALEQAEASMGSGTLEVIPAGACGVELARDAMRYLSEESCGACGACREGTRQLADMLDDIVGFRATAPGPMGLMHELAGAMKVGSICRLGTWGPTPLITSLELFATDFRAHIDEKRCPGGQSDA